MTRVGKGKSMLEKRRATAALSAAILAGVVAAGVAYLLYLRPRWRRQVVEIGRHLLNVAEGVADSLKPSTPATSPDEER